MIITLLYLQITLILVILYIFTISDLMYYIMISGIVSMITVFIYMILCAPDVAITEAVIGICATTGLFLLTILYIKKITKQSIIDKAYQMEYLDKRVIANIINICLFIVLCKIIYNLPTDTLTQKLNTRDMMDFYIKHTKIDFHFSSIVTAIVAHYRAFDTLFENIVVFLACKIFYNLMSTDGTK